MMDCVIVDDEPLAREGLTNYVKEIDFLNLSGVCANPVELISLLNQQAIDLVFLDIQMPKMTGIDFLKIFEKPPLVIITTAYPEFALEGFQLNVLDYLLKPVTFERFVKSVNKAHEQHFLINRASADHQATSDSRYVFVKCGNKYEKIYVDEILFIEGLQNYVTIHTGKSKYVTLLNLKKLEQELDAKAFIRVHKSFLVPVRKIDAIEGNEIFIQSHRIPISRSHRDYILNIIFQDKLWKK